MTFLLRLFPSPYFVNFLGAKRPLQITLSVRPMLACWAPMYAYKNSCTNTYTKIELETHLQGYTGFNKGSDDIKELGFTQVWRP